MGTLCSRCNQYNLNLFHPISHDIDGHLIFVMFILLILVFWVLHRCSFLFSVRIISFQIHGTPLDGFLKKFLGLGSLEVFIIIAYMLDLAVCYVKY